MQLSLTILLLTLLTSLMFFLSQSFGFMLVTAAVILLLTASYAVKYRREGVGAGLAYFGLAYVGFGLALLGIGLLQTHAGCMFLLSDCYQPTLPSWIDEFKTIFWLCLIVLNGTALYAALKNAWRHHN